MKSGHCSRSASRVGQTEERPNSTAIHERWHNSCLGRDCEIGAGQVFRFHTKKRETTMDVLSHKVHRSVNLKSTGLYLIELRSHFSEAHTRRPKLVSPAQPDRAGASTD